MTCTGAVRCSHYYNNLCPVIIAAIYRYNTAHACSDDIINIIEERSFPPSSLRSRDHSTGHRILYSFNLSDNRVVVA